MDKFIGVGIFVVFIAGLWFSYRLFMRGDTYAEKLASLLPKGFRPEFSYRTGDTYMGYEKATNRRGDLREVAAYPAFPYR
ncbi:MAG TPA: hypothetical protein VHQ02_04945 [Usitatibacter sp.]|nr:hypothetical protein [Usitatibacter sp.]